MAIGNACLLVTNFDLDKELDEWIILVLWKKNPYFSISHIYMNEAFLVLRHWNEPNCSWTFALAQEVYM